MAYREDITKQHLNEVAALLKKITSHKYSETKPGLAFKHAHSCLELLSDVRASLLERLPKLAQWTSWGPGYFHQEPNEGKDIIHVLGFAFTPDKWRDNASWFRGGFKFYAKGTVRWTIAWWPGKESSDIREITHSIDSVSSVINPSLGRTVRALDTDKMTKTVEEAARKWHIV